MAQSDLISRKTIQAEVQKVFEHYSMPYLPAGDVDNSGISAELPALLENMKPDYSLEMLIDNIQNGQSLNIPHQGLCINKDVVISMIRDGWLTQLEYEKADTLSDDLDRAIMFFKTRSFCDECTRTKCVTCNRYLARKNAIIALNFFRKVEDMQTRIEYLRDNAESADEKNCYDNMMTMFKEAYDYAVDRMNLA